MGQKWIKVFQVKILNKIEKYERREEGRKRGTSLYNETLPLRASLSGVFKRVFRGEMWGESYKMGRNVVSYREIRDVCCGFFTLFCGSHDTWRPAIGSFFF